MNRADFNATYEEYRRDPRIRIRQRLEYARKAFWLLLVIAACTGLAYRTGTPNPDRAGLLMGWVCFTLGAGINFVITGNHRFYFFTDIARELIEQDWQAMDRLRNSSLSTVEQLANAVIASAKQRASDDPSIGTRR